MHDFPLEGASDRPAPVREQGRRHRLLRPVLLSLGPVLAILGGIIVFLGDNRYVTTKNAYVQADIVLVSPEVAGKIVDVLVEDNEPVQRGDTLFKIDPTDFELRKAETGANVEVTRAAIDKLKALRRQKLQELKFARASLDIARREFFRYERLLEQQTVSTSNYDDAKHEYDRAMHQIRVMEEEISQIEAELAGRPDLPTDAHPRYRAVAAVRDLATRTLERTRVTAPFSGVVSQTPKVGQFVKPGDATIVIVATKDLWIEANFKETDLGKILPGQMVEVFVDAYPGHRINGVVASISQATGATFSLLPPQNATGNWIKVVQRFPVRITIADDKNTPALRHGMSVRAIIDTTARRLAADPPGD